MEEGWLWRRGGCNRGVVEEWWLWRRDGFVGGEVVREGWLWRSVVLWASLYVYRLLYGL